jgi:phage gpG-like protein
MTVRKTGDWAKAASLLRSGPLKIRGAIGMALRQEAQLLRKEIVQGITRQAPGGEPFQPLSPLTIAARKLAGFGGTKALMRRGDLRNSISVVVKEHEAFVGILRKAKGKDGRSLVNLAEVHEYGKGPIIIPMTPAMRRYLFLLLKRAGVTKKTGRGKGVVVTSIPARPFLRPAFDKFSRGARKRFLSRVARLLKMGGL